MDMRLSTARYIVPTSKRWGRERPGVFGHVIGLRRHARVLPSRTRPSLYAGD